MVYLDNNGTTRVPAEVIAVMSPIERQIQSLRELEVWKHLSLFC